MGSFVGGRFFLCVGPIGFLQDGREAAKKRQRNIAKHSRQHADGKGRKTGEEDKIETPCPQHSGPVWQPKAFTSQPGSAVQASSSVRAMLPSAGRVADRGLRKALNAIFPERALSPRRRYVVRIPTRASSHVSCLFSVAQHGTPPHSRSSLRPRP